MSGTRISPLLSKHLIIAIALIGLFFGCSYDQIKIEPGLCNDSLIYNDHIDEIISRNCSYAGCHDGASGNPGNFTSYNGLVSRVSNGQVTERVISQQDMPPSNASGPTQLTESELMDLNCWIEQGYPEQ